MWSSWSPAVCLHTHSIDQFRFVCVPELCGCIKVPQCAFLCQSQYTGVVPAFRHIWRYRWPNIPLMQTPGTQRSPDVSPHRSRKHPGQAGGSRGHWRHSSTKTKHRASLTNCLLGLILLENVCLPVTWMKQWNVTWTLAHWFHAPAFTAELVLWPEHCQLSMKVACLRWHHIACYVSILPQTGYRHKTEKPHAELFLCCRMNPN